MCFFLLVLTVQVAAAQQKVRWQTGQLVAADLSGHTRYPKSQTRPQQGGRSDIWWVYCFSTGTKAYSAVSRTSPDKANLVVGHSVQFQVERDRIQILDLKGRRHVMRINRQGDLSICR